jgi:hypothetical protein
MVFGNEIRTGKDSPRCFQRHVAAHMKEPDTVIRKHDSQNRRHIKRTETKAFDPVWGMELGEFFYCLRSGLDQMAWQLANPTARTNSARDIQFPIFDDLTGDRLKTYTRILSLFPAEVATEIDALQPHKGPSPPQDHPLSQLHKLCNLDKHISIPIHGRISTIYFPHVPGVRVEHFDREGAFEVSVPEEFESELNFEPALPRSIQIGEWNSDWNIPISRLNEIYEFIDTVVPKFTPFNLADVPIQSLRMGKASPIYRG